MRRIATVLTVLVAGTLGGFMTAAPAHAAPQLEGYVAITPNGGTYPGWFWIDEMDGIIGCPQCLHWFDVDVSQQLHADEEATLNGGVIAGLGLLSDAQQATDPRIRDGLRADAMTHFASAARALGTARPLSGQVGYYDPDQDLTVATGSVWLAAALEDIVDGLSFTQIAIDPRPDPWGPTPDPWGPTPEPWAAAIVQFDEAFQEIATKEAIGG